MVKDLGNSYNYEPQMRSPLPRQRVKDPWTQRIMVTPNGRPLTRKAELTIPNWIVSNSVICFIVAFIACNIAYGYPMEIRDIIISSISVLLFLYGSRVSSTSWCMENDKIFMRNVFVIGLAARMLWVVYCYFFFNPDYYGTPYGHAGDVEWYMPFGEAIAQWIRDGFPISFTEVMRVWNSAIDDVGYPIWLGVINILTFGESDVFVPFLIKCIIGAYSAICIYHIAKRHFGGGPARMAALFVALNPNMIFWCGTMLKETEMVFLCSFCVDLVDRAFTSGQKLTFKGLVPGLLVGMYLFFFRSALAIVLFMAMFAHIVMASSRVMSAGKKVIAGIMVGVVLLVGMGDRLRMQTTSFVERVQSGEQEKNMEWRSKKSDGNSFAKYAGKAVFAPLIFTIPFPTFNMADGKQIIQAQLSGGNYIKNVFSFFVLLVMFMMLLKGEWRNHVFILAYTLGYLLILVMSNFAQSSRFHMPIWPMLMMFAAYGIQISKSNPRYRHWYVVVLVVEVAVCLAWNWFKLAGRGMI